MTDIIKTLDKEFYYASKNMYTTIKKDLSYISREYTESNDTIYTNLCKLAIQKIGSMISYYIFKCAYTCKCMDNFLIPDAQEKVHRELKQYLLDEFTSPVQSYDFEDLRYDDNKLLLKILLDASRLVTSRYDDILPVLPPEFKQLSLRDNFRHKHDRIMDILVLLVFKFNHFGKDFNPYLSSLGFIKLDNLLDTDYIKIHKFYSTKKCRNEQEILCQLKKF